MSRIPSAHALLLTLAVAGGAAPSAGAATAAPGWLVNVTPAPSQLKPGSAAGLIRIRLSNVGAVASSGAITITDTLPAGVTATAVSSPSGAGCTTAPLSCTLSGSVVSGGVAAMEIAVTVDPAAAGAPDNTVTVSGGGAAPATRTTPVPIGTGGLPFGAVDHQTVFVDRDGSPVTQAGSHPWAQVTDLTFSQHVDALGALTSDAAAK